MIRDGKIDGFSSRDTFSGVVSMHVNFYIIFFELYFVLVVCFGFFMNEIVIE